MHCKKCPAPRQRENQASRTLRCGPETFMFTQELRHTKPVVSLITQIFARTLLTVRLRDDTLARTAVHDLNVPAN